MPGQTSVPRFARALITLPSFSIRFYDSQAEETVLRAFIAFAIHCQPHIAPPYQFSAFPKAKKAAVNRTPPPISSISFSPQNVQVPSSSIIKTFHLYTPIIIGVHPQGIWPPDTSASHCRRQSIHYTHAAFNTKLQSIALLRLECYVAGMTITMVVAVDWLFYKRRVKRSTIPYPARGYPLSSVFCKVRYSSRWRQGQPVPLLSTQPRLCQTARYRWPSSRTSRWS